MNPELRDLMSSQNGLILRRQVRAAGISTHETDLLVKRREWVAVRRGVYTTHERWDAWDEYRERPLARALAASLAMLHPHVISHDSAALLHDLPLVRTPSFAHVTRFGVQGPRHQHGVKHHLAPFEAWQVVRRRGVPALDPVRTVADLAREHGLRTAVCAADAVVRRGVSTPDIEDTIRQMRSWPGVTVVREAFALADPGAESPGETLTRLALIETLMGPVETQFGLHRDGRTAWCDLRIGRHVVEFDGRIKYLPEQQGGFARDDRALWDEKLRRDFVQSFRLGMSRVVWPDLQATQWSSTVQRLRREIEATDRLFGRDLSDLTAHRLDKALRLAA